MAPAHKDNKCGTLFWATDAAIFGLVGAIVVFGASFLEFALLLVSFFYAWFLIGTLGVMLVAMRLIFFAIIPTLIKYAKPIVIYINYLRDVFDTVENFFIVVINIFELVIEAVAALTFGAWDPGKMSFVKFVKYNQITVKEYLDELTIIQTECAHIDSTASIADQWVPHLIDEATCPYYRAMWPLPHHIGPHIYNTFGKWVSNPEPWLGNNCNANTTTKHGVLCASLAVGYPMLEVVLPSVILGIFALSVLGPMTRVITYFIRAAIDIVMIVACNLSTAIHTSEAVLKMLC
jgi:hypothetical protein